MWLAVKLLKLERSLSLMCVGMCRGWTGRVDGVAERKQKMFSACYSQTNLQKLFSSLQLKVIRKQAWIKQVKWQTGEGSQWNKKWKKALFLNQCPTCPPVSLWKVPHDKSRWCVHLCIPIALCAFGTYQTACTVVISLLISLSH